MYRPVMLSVETWTLLKVFSLKTGRTMKDITGSAVAEYVAREDTPEARIRAALSMVCPPEEVDSAVSEALKRLPGARP